MTKLSVVMAVFNGEAALPSTLASILTQDERDFELIVVDDGSTDGTAAILSDAASRDSRLRILTQANGGLTRALINGCAAATAPVIARHDCGDRSEANRFTRQLALLRDGVALVACGVRAVGPKGELLYETHASGDEIRESLLRDPLAKIRSIPHHGTAMFPRAAYQAAGGYRAQFRVAQDLDLWIRMAALGTIAIAPDVLYEASVDPDSISGTARDEQFRIAAISIALRDGGDERALLAAAEGIRPRRKRRSAGGLYFIASCLRERGNPAWRDYAKRAIARDPFHWRAWLALLTRR